MVHQYHFRLLFDKIQLDRKSILNETSFLQKKIDGDFIINAKKKIALKMAAFEFELCRLITNCHL